MLTVPMYEGLVGLRVTEIVTKPLVDGRYEQVAIMFGEDPVVDLFLQPGSILLLTLKIVLTKFEETKKNNKNINT